MSGSPPSPQNPNRLAGIITVILVILIILLWTGSHYALIPSWLDPVLGIVFAVLGGASFIYGVVRGGASSIYRAARSVFASRPLPPSQPLGNTGGPLLQLVNTVLLVVLLVLSVGKFFPHPLLGCAVGVSVSQMGNQLIGISDGCYTFDTQRDDSDLKQDAANAFRQGDFDTAMSKWNGARAKDKSDAETLIYSEDQMNSNKPHVTFVAATLLSGDRGFIGTGRSDLQGVYVAQHDANEQCMLRQGSTCYYARVLIANLGGDEVGASTVAQQIVTLKERDPTFVGVVGLPVSLPPIIDAIRILADQHIPILSTGASSDVLTDPFVVGASRLGYFRRPDPPDSEHGPIAAQFAAEELNAHTVAVLSDDTVPYSQTLASSFKRSFALQNSSANVLEEHYTKGNKGSIGAALDQALGHQPPPDLLYFAGYSQDLDALLDALLNFPDTSKNLRIMGGDALYQLGGYSQSNFKRIYFTGFAYPDEWSSLAPGKQAPRLFTEYPQTFGPTPPGQSPYGYTRADSSVILAYDAMSAMLKGCYNIIHNDRKMPIPESLHQALKELQFQGASGQITFSDDGNPVDKVILVLCVGSDSQIHLVGAHGRFLLSDKTVQTRSFPLASCA